MIIEKNKDLHTFNTFGVSALTQFFALISSKEDVFELLETPEWQQQSHYILGGGSNILFTEPYAGIIVKNEIKGIKRVDETEDHIFLQIGAGENWHQCVMYCVRQGWGGIENLSLIPGTVGAAPIQNIGAYGAELKEVFHSLEAINLQDGSCKTFSKEECQFSYRDSIFKSNHQEKYIIVNVTLKLSKQPIFNLSYDILQETIEKMGIVQLTLQTVSEAVMQIRRSKLPDPAVLGNAGSFFKNPIISQNDFQKLQSTFSNVPAFTTDIPDTVKVSAGWLIEQCGWKGKRYKNVGVHEHQALVLVNYGSGTGREVISLAKLIQDSVLQRFQIQLVPEVNIL